MRSERSEWLPKIGEASAWGFALLLGYAALGPGRVMFEGVSWQRSLVTLLFLAACAVYLICSARRCSRGSGPC